MFFSESKECIIVLGMHRSGTSTISGLLNILGYNIGKHIQSPNIYNPKGFFENKKIMILNDRILSQLDATWDNTLHIKENWFKGFNNRQQIIQELKTVFISEYHNETKILIKDPRLCSLVPLYNKVIKENNYKIRFVITYRKPLKVAASLNKKWNNFSTEKALLLYLDHLLKAEKNTRFYNRVFVNYDSILSDPLHVAEQISKKLKLSFDISIQNKNRILQFVDQRLNHNTAAHHQEGTQLVALAMQLYNTLEDFNLENISFYKTNRLVKINRIYKKTLLSD